MQTELSCSAFAGTTKIACGHLPTVAKEVKQYLEQHPEQTVLVFEDDSARPVELDLRGTLDQVLARLTPEPTPERKPGPGRPKLGVESHEVSLLPRHWAWLNSQPGGASGTIRRLVEEARKKNEGKDRAREAQEAAHRFMWAMTGNLPGFEEASRAFYARDYAKMRQLISPWPRDLRDHLQTMVDRVQQLQQAAGDEP